MENKPIFKYTKSPSLGLTKEGIEIYDKEKDNIICISNSKSITTYDKKVRILPYEVILEIKKVISKNENLKNITKTERPLVMDGYTNTFEILFDNKLHKIRGTNLSFYIFEDTEDSSKANAVLKFYDFISKILIENGIEKEYFSLG
ncbi:hypothetical protein ACWOAQ_05340 [Helcococcus kunzii]|uniref:hypothetical protein n=1 Tax=Helcococcus kunzii TaxID=40091 RepID=UPI001BAFFD45|nr:hypothetical protein [Helcococcus kunzii]QUY65668.1 hypothetical protein GUI37_09100 [Helcococcus kunzii]